MKAPPIPGAKGSSGGSGGRTALYAATIDPGLVDRTSAPGAVSSSTDPGRSGAAGTIFVKLDADAVGDLIVDNGGSPSSQYTELLSAGRGTVGSVMATSFTDPAADFRHSLIALEVYTRPDSIPPELERYIWPKGDLSHTGKCTVVVYWTNRLSKMLTRSP